MRKSFCLFVLLFSWGFMSQAQEEVITSSKKDSVIISQSEAFLDVIEHALISYYREQVDKSFSDSIVAIYGYEEHDVPTFSDSVYCARLSAMNELSPFHLDCNAHVLQTIDFFVRKRRKFTSITLGRSALYFPMFEEKLAKHDMPLELKYLSVIESGLRPQVKSKAGALGLWQFMYRTGKMYGLNENSYIDERMDPELATEAACLYLKKLHSMYDDWNMALAAYNAGPGNVNKAIRRSGGKMTYWEIRPYLPRETQGYVPNFIAMAYLMTHYTSHNILPLPPAVYDFELDTVCLKQGVHMQSIDSVIAWKVEDIQLVNPIYKTTYIPMTQPKQCITIPIPKVKDWIAMEDSIYRMDSILFSLPSNKEVSSSSPPSSTPTTTHTVRSGESLSVIARKYGVTVNNLMDWNNLRSTNLKIGQKLNVHGKLSSSTEQQTKPSNVTKGDMHTIKSGDSLWKIATMYETTVDELQRLNPYIDYTDLKVGQQVKIK